MTSSPGIRPERRLVVYRGAERFPLANGIEAVPLIDLCGEACGDVILKLAPLTI